MCTCSSGWPLWREETAAEAAHPWRGATGSSNGVSAMTKKFTRRTVLSGLAGISLASKTRAEADWPTRTIAIIHGFPAGGPSDVIARLLADGLSRSLGQAEIVEPRPGAAGTAAA